MTSHLATDSVMVATIGGQPQVVTFALDALLARGEQVREVVVLHLSPRNPRFGRALSRLSDDSVWSFSSWHLPSGGHTRVEQRHPKVGRNTVTVQIKNI